MTLDVKVWDEAVLSMMEGLGNEVANDNWEAELHSESNKCVCIARASVLVLPLYTAGFKTVRAVMALGCCVACIVITALRPAIFRV